MDRKQRDYIFLLILFSTFSMLIGAFIGTNTRIFSFETNNKKKATSENVTEGDAGMLLIDDVGIRVPLFLTDVVEEPDYTQKVVDRENSAAYIKYKDVYIIADHVGQDFSNLSNVKPGTKAVIKNGDTKETYECVELIKGRNNVDMIEDINGTKITELAKDRLAMYTCADTWEDILLTLWDKVES